MKRLLLIFLAAVGLVLATGCSDNICEADKDCRELEICAEVTEDQVKQKICLPCSSACQGWMGCPSGYQCHYYANNCSSCMRAP